MAPTAGLDDVEKRNFLTLLGLEFQPRGLPKPLYCGLMCRLYEKVSDACPEEYSLL
jgi:hypothetical protein